MIVGNQLLDDFIKAKCNEIRDSTNNHETTPENRVAPSREEYLKDILEFMSGNGPVKHYYDYFLKYLNSSPNIRTLKDISNDPLLMNLLFGWCEIAGNNFIHKYALYHSLASLYQIAIDRLFRHFNLNENFWKIKI